MKTPRAKPLKLEGKTNAELSAMMEEEWNDPRNRNTPGSLFIFNKRGQQRTNRIARAVTANLADSRAAAGRPVPTCGYSGRQTNRRR